MFGPDRDGEPGITPVPGSMPPQITDWMTESAAIHSKSRGWLPAVVVRIATEDGAGLVGSIKVGPELLEIIEGMATAIVRGAEDVHQAIKDGTLK